MSHPASDTDEITAARRPWWRRAPVVVPVLLILLVLAIVAAAVLQPWKLVVDQVVDEPVPAVSPSPGRPDKRDAGPKVLAEGEFIGQEHETTGSVEILELADGSRVLRLVDLDTSNGPELEVWLADAPVREGTDGWFVFDDGRYVSLGPLKGNVGNQNYPVPAAVDLGDYSAVSIWCARFRVSFGAAALTAAT